MALAQRPTPSVIVTADDPALRAELKQANANRDYLYARRLELLHSHPNQWVIVSERRVVAFAATLDEVIAAMRVHGIQPRHVIIDYLDTDDTPQIL